MSGGTISDRKKQKIVKNTVFAIWPIYGLFLKKRQKRPKNVHFRAILRRFSTQNVHGRAFSRRFGAYFGGKKGYFDVGTRPIPTKNAYTLGRRGRFFLRGRGGPGGQKPLKTGFLGPWGPPGAQNGRFSGRFGQNPLLGGFSCQIALRGRFRAASAAGCIKNS